MRNDTEGAIRERSKSPGRSALTEGGRWEDGRTFRSRVGAFAAWLRDEESIAPSLLVAVVGLNVYQLLAVVCHSSVDKSPSCPREDLVHIPQVRTDPISVASAVEERYLTAVITRESRRRITG